MLLLSFGDVLFNHFQKIGEGDLWGRNVLAWIIEGMNVPTDKGVVSTKYPCGFFYESVRALFRVGVEKDINEGII